MVLAPWRRRKIKHRLVLHVWALMRLMTPSIAMILVELLVLPFRVHAMMVIFIIDEDVSPQRSMYLTTL